jgi:hypothetical protein
MLDDTHINRDQVPEPQAAGHGKREEGTARQKIVLVVTGVVAGAALVTGGFFLAGSHTTNLTPLQYQVTMLEHDVNSDNAQAASDTSQISALNSEVETLEGEYGLLKIDGITTYNESCPIGGVWVPCGKNEPPGFGPQG